MFPRSNFRSVITAQLTNQKSKRNNIKIKGLKNSEFIVARSRGKPINNGTVFINDFRAVMLILYVAKDGHVKRKFVI